jgi:hypothetical protein
LLPLAGAEGGVTTVGAVDCGAAAGAELASVIMVVGAGACTNSAAAGEVAGAAGAGVSAGVD